MATLAEGPNLLRDRSLTGMPAAVAGFLAAPCELVSAVCWRTAADWSIPPRTCLDTLLFASRDEAVEIQLGGRWRPVAADGLVVIPARVEHAARYRGRRRHWEVIALHVLHHDAAGADLWAGFTGPIHRIHGWRDALLDLTAQHNRGGSRVEAAALVRALAVSLLIGGGGYRPPPAADARVGAALRLLAEDPGIAIAAVAEAVGLRPARFRQRFREVVGMAPKVWLQRRRLERAAHLLRTTTDSVQAIAAELAFASDHQFHAEFKRAYGLSLIHISEPTRPY